jgi:hypothetical protein
MEAFLWSFEALVRLCGHQDPEVKGWSADRVRRLYPKEAGPLMVGLLSDRDGSVAAQAAAYFCAYPDRNIADALLAAFRKSSGMSAERLAESLMKSHESIYEVQDVREGEGLTIRDVLGRTSRCPITGAPGSSFLCFRSS